jgi:hypothetical protein
MESTEPKAGLPILETNELVVHHLEKGVTQQ